jgi:hypothetical protein
MAISSLLSASDILNRVAAEIGVSPIADPFSSDDPTFVRMRYLLNIAGEELVEAHKWEQLLKEHQIITADGDTGDYALPADFAYMVNQTGWERSQQVSLGGPLTSEQWAYLKGRKLDSNSLYVTFRLADGKFKVLPSPPPIGLDINFEYVSTQWVRSATQSPTYTYSDTITTGDQVPIFNKTLISRYLKVKMLDATGFDTTSAQADFNQMFSFLTGTEKGAPILNAGGGRGFPYLGRGNIPDTGFGL